MVWSRIIRWSQVALTGIPPDWASISWPSFVTLSLMILPNTFLRLLANVIPLPFEHFPLVPVPLYGLRIWPTCQLSGNSSFTCILLKASLKIYLIFLFASMNVSCHLVPDIFPFQFFMAVPISFGDICSGSSVVCSVVWSVFYFCFDVFCPVVIFWDSWSCLV